MMMMFRMFRKNLFLFPQTVCHIFNVIVMPVLTYASELWAYGESASIERIFLKFAKYILEVPLNTSNLAVLGELGLYPVWVSTKLKAVNFWNRICEGNASFGLRICQQLLKIQVYWSRILS